MTQTALNAALDHVARLWAQVVPEDRPSQVYHRLDEGTSEIDPSKRNDDAADRGFYFEQGVSTTLEERGSDLELRETPITARVFFSVERIGAAKLRASMDNEIQRLRRAVDTETVWPSGVLEVFTDEPGPEGVDEADNLAASSIVLVVTAEES